MCTSEGESAVGVVCQTDKQLSSIANTPSVITLSLAYFQEGTRACDQCTFRRALLLYNPILLD